MDARLWTPIAATLLLVGVAVTFQPKSVKEDTSKPPVRIGYMPNLTHAPALLALTNGTFAATLGDKGRVLEKEFNAGPEIAQALLSGQLDFAYMGPGPALNAFAKNDRGPVRILQGVCSGGASLVVNRDSKIKSIADLRGQQVAVPQLGNTQDVSLRYFLEQNGLQPVDRGGSVAIVALKNPDILVMMKRHLAAAWVPEPWATRIVKEANATRLVDERTLWPNGEFATTVLVGRTQYLQEHPDIVRSMLTANEIAIKQMEGSGAAQKVNEAFGKLTGKPLSKAVLEESWSFMKFSPYILKKQIIAQAHAAQANGYIPKGEDSWELVFERSLGGSK